MRPLPFVIAVLAVVCVAAGGAQPPRLTVDYPALARRSVQQLGLSAGERVMSLTHPGLFDDLVPHLRYEVMRAGGIDLGVVEVLREPAPATLEPPVLLKRRPPAARPR